MKKLDFISYSIALIINMVCILIVLPAYILCHEIIHKYEHILIPCIIISILIWALIKIYMSILKLKK